jgi:hypothetical protein
MNKKPLNCCKKCKFKIRETEHAVHCINTKISYNEKTGCFKECEENINCTPCKLFKKEQTK